MTDLQFYQSACHTGCVPRSAPTSWWVSRVWRLARTMKHRFWLAPRVAAFSAVRQKTRNHMQQVRKLVKICPTHVVYVLTVSVRCDVGLEEVEYWKKLSLSYSIVYYYNGAQRYKQLLQVGWLHRALILLGLALCLPSSYIYIFKIFCFHSLLCLVVSWDWWDWPLTWLTNRHPSVLWHCWLGHLTRKII